MATFKINQTGVNHLLRSREGPVVRHFDQIAEKTWVLAVFNAPNSPYASGTLRNALSHQTIVHAGYSITARAGVLRTVEEPFRWYDSGKTPRPTAAGVLIIKRSWHGFIRPRGTGYKLRFGTPGARGANFAGIRYANFTQSAAPNDFLVDAFKRASPYRVTVVKP